MAAGETRRVSATGPAHASGRSRSLHTTPCELPLCANTAYHSCVGRWHVCILCVFFDVFRALRATSCIAADRDLMGLFGKWGSLPEPFCASACWLFVLGMYFVCFVVCVRGIPLNPVIFAEMCGATDATDIANMI